MPVGCVFLFEIPMFFAVFHANRFFSKIVKKRTIFLKKQY